MHVLVMLVEQIFCSAVNLVMKKAVTVLKLHTFLYTYTFNDL